MIILLFFLSQVFIDELEKMSIKCNYPNQHQIIPNNNSRLVQIPVDHHLHAQLRNEDVLEDPFSSSISVSCIFFFFSVQRLFLILSVDFRVCCCCFLLSPLFSLSLVCFFLYITMQKRHFCHLSINYCLFPLMKPAEFLCACVDSDDGL